MFERLASKLRGLFGDSEQGLLWQRMAGGAFWSLVAEMALKVLTLVASVVVARKLGPEQFGQYGMIQNTLLMCGGFAGMGLGTATTKFVAEYRRKEPARAAAVIALTTALALLTSVVITLACWLGAPWIAEVALQQATLTPLVRIGACMLVGLIVGGVLTAVLSGLEEFRSLATVRIFQGFIGVAGSVVLVWQWGLNGAMAASTLTALAGLCFIIFSVQRHVRALGLGSTNYAAIRGEWQIIPQFAVPAFVSSQLVVPVLWLANQQLVREAGGYEDLGLFNAANQWRSLLMFLPGLLGNALLPMLSETHAREDKTAFTDVVMMNLRMIWQIALPMTVLLVLYGDFFSAIFGKNFTGTEKIMPYLMLSTLFSMLCGPLGAAIAGAGQMWGGTWLNLAWGASLLVLAWLLVPLHGGVGLALAYALAYLVQLGLALWYLHRRLVPGLFRRLAGLLQLSVLVLPAAAWLAQSSLDVHPLWRLLLLALSGVPLANTAFQLWQKIFGKQQKEPAP